MFAVKLFTFMLIGIALQHVAEARQGMCAGCPVDVDPNREDIKQTLGAVLAGRNSPDVVLKIVKAQVQVVNGARYVVDFEAQTPGTNEVKLCHTDYVSRPWVTKAMEVVDFECKVKQ
uniref:Venom cystatin-like protein 5 n=1 Tax=Pristhesancus plagipennis TaxID=1955184 RepID=A0A1Q1NPB3_PRIPG|nr:venom cystatin-like protein 5 [Pristhesancus plagipennis]